MVKHHKIIICLILLAVLVIPAVNAITGRPNTGVGEQADVGKYGQSWNDNPEHIAAMQAYTAYSGELFKAKMDGAIQYIGTLNQSTVTLQNDEQQFLVTVASVQTMTTDDSITQAWGTMTTQVAQFRTDLKTALSVR